MSFGGFQLVQNHLWQHMPACAIYFMFQQYLGRCQVWSRIVSSASDAIGLSFVGIGWNGSVWICPVGSRLIELLPMNSRDSSRLGLCSVVLHFGPIQFEPASSGIQRFSWWSYILIFQQNSSVWTCLAVWDPNQSHSCQEHTIWNYVKKCGVRCDHVKSIHCQSLQPLIDFFG